MAYEQGQITDADGGVLFPQAVRPRGFFPRLRGLIGRMPLSDQQAWWFSSCASVHTMGMSFAIDVIHLDAQSRVLRVREAIRPQSMSVARGGCHVIELSEGSASRAGICLGQELRFTT